MRIQPLFAVVFTGILTAPISMADQVEIVAVKMEKQDSRWTARVTLRHADTGWDHYADSWRVVDASGNVYGHRTLFHPHEQEQPFTRSLSNIVIPATETVVYVEAHDKVHGWSPDKVKVDLSTTKGERYRVNK